MKRRANAAIVVLMLWSWLVCISLLASGPDLSTLEAKFDRIVRASRGEVGISLIHVESGARLAIHGDQRFPMASVYKLPIALELLVQVAQGTLALDRQVPLGPSDIRACCTLSRRHPNGGVTLSANELLELMIVESDNTASDAVLKLVGGPAVVERRMRALGFGTINVNRYEGDINFEMTGVLQPPPQAQWTLELQRRLIAEVRPEALRAARARYTRDPRDTATPDDMARFLARLQLGNLLPRASTDLLLDMMARAKTGPHRIKALLPPDTSVAHKTGTTDVVINDVGIVTLPDDSVIGGHLVLAAFAMNGGRVTAMQQTIAQLAGAAFEFFTGKPLPPPEKPKPAPKKKRTKRR
jgi:beta-lactamase class A